MTITADPAESSEAGNEIANWYDQPAKLIRRYSSYLIALLAITVSLLLLYRLFRDYSLEDLRQSLVSADIAHLTASIGFAAASYLTLTGFDYLALIYAGKRQSWRRAALASFCGLSIGHNVGFAALSSGTVRYRLYSRWGLGAGDIAKVIAFCGMTVGLGMGVLGGVALVLQPQLAADLTGLGQGTLIGFGIAILVLILAYVALCHFKRTPLFACATVQNDWAIQKHRLSHFKAYCSYSRMTPQGCIIGLPCRQETLIGLQLAGTCCWRCRKRRDIVTLISCCWN